MSKIFINYLPAELKENKEWYVRYYALNPSSNKLEIKKIRINRIKSIKERRKYGKKLVVEINKKLEGGWNPFVEQSSSKGYHNIYKAFDTFLNVKIKELRPQSIRTYKSNLKLFKEFLIKTDTEEKMFALSFSNGNALQFMNYMYLERNVSERRYNGMLLFCRILFNWMQQYGYVKANPFDTLKKKKEKQKTREVIPYNIRAEIKEFLQEESIEFLAILMIEFHALLRPNEILNLKISDIDLNNQTIQVQPQNAKNGKFRLSTIPDVLVEYIKQLKLEKYNSELYAFSNDLKPGKIVKNVRFTGKRWASMRKKLGFKKEYQMYSLRDTGIINLIQSGVSLEVVAKQAGHADLTITSRYALHADKSANEQIKNKSKEF